jgi:hypothetical protein
MQKLDQSRKDVTLAALGPPPDPLVLPAVVPGQSILTYAQGGDPSPAPENVAAAFGVMPQQVRYAYGTVLQRHVFPAQVGSDRKA